MGVPAMPARKANSLRDRELIERLQRLRRTDNHTNWLYLARAYAVLSLAVALAVAGHQALAAGGFSWWWSLPIFAVAAVAVGASQHQLGGATHEATHYTLFRNRWLNEVVSDWLCMFPLFSSTYVFRLHHLAHHQFINDPERDPDFAQLRASGHWLRFPVLKSRFFAFLAAQAILLPLVRYILVRGRFNSVGVRDNPYVDPGQPFSARPARLGLLYFPALFVGLWVLSAQGAPPLWLVAVPAVACAAMVLYYLLIPDDRFFKARLHPVISHRSTLIQRVLHATLVAGGLAWLARATGGPVWGYFLALWVAPMFTTFALFMILRQLVQHGNGDRGWLTNTRTFLVNPLIRYAVFPFGMDYHLPHHMFATIPHYRLPRLHALLLEYPEYAERGTVVEGYFFPRHEGPGRNPTVLEVLGPAYTPPGEDIFIDDSVLEGTRDATPPPHPPARAA